MQHFYVLRRFSSWSFRLGVSVALLVSSAGLAASMLVEAATSEAERAHAAWQPLTDSPRSVSELPTIRSTYTASQPLPAQRVAPLYLFAANATDGGSLAQATAGYPTQGVASSEAPPAVEDSSWKATMQRSWRTFKLAFR